MFIARWNGEKIAESDIVVELEGNRYFPWDTVRHELLNKSTEQTSCAWKGQCSYFDIIVKGDTNSAAAWYYPAPKPEAKQIQDHIAFWKGVEVIEIPT